MCIFWAYFEEKPARIASSMTIMPNSDFVTSCNFFWHLKVFYHHKEDCTLPHMFRRKLPESSGFHWNPPDSNPGMSWCDKGQISIFIPGGVRRSPLETSIFQRSPWNPSGLFPLSKSTGLWRNPVSGGVQRTPAESSGIQWNIRNPAESSGLQQSLFIASLFNY